MAARGFEARTRIHLNWVDAAILYSLADYHTEKFVQNGLLEEKHALDEKRDIHCDPTSDQLYLWHNKLFRGSGLYVDSTILKMEERLEGMEKRGLVLSHSEELPDKSHYAPKPHLVKRYCIA